MFIDYLFPKRCVSCKKIGTYLCSTCQTYIRYFNFTVCPVCDRPTYDGKTHPVCQSPLGLDGFLAFVQYEDSSASFSKAVKYGRIRDATNEGYRILAPSWPVFAPKFDLFLPIPLHPKKLALRGFNQAELFARYLSAQTKVPINTRTLIKIRETTPQASLRLKERKHNMEQGYVCLYKKDVQNKIIGLIDDVATTRTTLSLACQVLKKSSAKAVWGIVLAHKF